MSEPDAASRWEHVAAVEAEQVEELLEQNDHLTMDLLAAHQKLANIRALCDVWAGAPQNSVPLNDILMILGRTDE